MGWIILIVCAFIALGMYSCCVIVKQADEDAERMYREWVKRNEQKGK